MEIKDKLNNHSKQTYTKSIKKSIDWTFTVLQEERWVFHSLRVQLGDKLNHSLLLGGQGR